MVVHGSLYTTYLNIVAITASPRLYRDTMPLTEKLDQKREAITKARLTGERGERGTRAGGGVGE